MAAGVGEPADQRAEGVRAETLALKGGAEQDVEGDLAVVGVVLLLGDVSPQALRSVALRLAAHVARTGVHPVVLEADYHGLGWSIEPNGRPGLGELLYEW